MSNFGTLKSVLCREQRSSSVQAPTSARPAEKCGTRRTKVTLAGSQVATTSIKLVTR